MHEGFGLSIFGGPRHVSSHKAQTVQQIIQQHSQENDSQGPKASSNSNLPAWVSIDIGKHVSRPVCLPCAGWKGFPEILYIYYWSLWRLNVCTGIDYIACK